uniref:Calmodulin-binding transcription activator 1 n=1 Tax=Tetraselmis sp. GSL018 TaxID=582737 RepID=A0A061R7K3_9CHLO|eukprot:CAMPEP_0177599798 /NCGR_PEP_ID=MMETSP0419_2-20121207/13212_1 /TAXON_ID=582737 /ORGANISM="Tetraselmis sp., Strain GSL018" /LENGTH=561 /DNA_ID=CAMNT_0019092609 /DNA_START=531 /DNA_END=2216 /DNA_ORIENTATION=+
MLDRTWANQVSLPCPLGGTTKDTGALPLQPSPCLPSTANSLLFKAKSRWLKGSELLELFRLSREGNFACSVTAAVQPSGGLLYLYDRKAVRFFRLDGHEWRKKKDGKTVRETHEKLKVGNVEALNCYYAHALNPPNLQRRCYWQLECDQLVLVHYLDPVAPGSSRRLPLTLEEQLRAGAAHARPAPTAASCCEERLSGSAPPMGFNIMGFGPVPNPQATAALLMGPLSRLPAADRQAPNHAKGQPRFMSDDGACSLAASCGLPAASPPSTGCRNPEIGPRAAADAPLPHRFASWPTAFPYTADDVCQVDPFSAVQLPDSAHPGCWPWERRPGGCGRPDAMCTSVCAVPIEPPVLPHPAACAAGPILGDQELPLAAPANPRVNPAFEGLIPPPNFGLSPGHPGRPPQAQRAAARPKRAPGWFCLWDMSPEAVGTAGGDKVMMVGSASQHLEHNGPIYVSVDGEPCLATVSQGGSVLTFVARPHIAGTACVLVVDSEGRRLSADTKLVFRPSARRASSPGSSLSTSGDRDTQLDLIRRCFVNMDSSGYSDIIRRLRASASDSG